MSDEAKKHYNEFISKFTKKHNLTVEQAEETYIVKEYIRFLKREFPE